MGGGGWVGGRRPHHPLPPKGHKGTSLDNRVMVKGNDGQDIVLYAPQPHQQKYHESEASNLLALGTRGTGKSLTMRWDAIIRCLMFPGFKALIIRRKLTDLRKSHLLFIGSEMKMLGCGTYRQNTMDAVFDNGSVIQFSHCESDADIDNYLSSEWDYIGFDELSTFTLPQFLKISAAARTPTNKPYRALVRACSNPLGPGAPWMKQWFIDKNVDYSEYPDYVPDDFEMQFSTLEDNKYVNREEYERRLRNLPEHVRRAWLRGEFVIEGAYFTDFHKMKEVDEDFVPWHVIKTMPTWNGRSIFDLPWISVYRAIDWGYHPDPAVCLWIAVLPNKHAIVFKEMTWKRTLARDVALAIKRESQGMHIVDSLCDPTMFVKTGTIEYSIGELFEQQGVPLTAAQNSRELYGYSIHEQLNTLIDQHPQIQIVEYACPNLIRTIQTIQMDPLDPRKIAEGEDHWVVALAYYAMGKALPSHDPKVSAIPRWMTRHRGLAPLV